LSTVALAQRHSGEALGTILARLGLSPATYYRWCARAAAGQLEDRIVIPPRHVARPTPAEVAAVCDFALQYPAMGYKRLAWAMVDQDVAYLRPSQVYRILIAQELIARRPLPLAASLHRPAPAQWPDQVWHIDLMYVQVRPRWYYLVDILDAYSRYLVHWSLNATMTADTVTLTVQQAIEKLGERRNQEPKIVHDHGSQFVGREWRTFVAGAGLGDIRTRVAHPQSNGLVERLHRTHREEGLIGEEATTYPVALAAMAAWGHYYNHARPHSALDYLYPVDYYRGDPARRLAERASKLAQGAANRGAYWQD
jgi:putative transposase